jgi:Ni/Fe-hydrogenase subunit HybB-like protein
MLGDFAEYAGALILPLLLIGATLAIVVAGLAAVFHARSRFLRVAYTSLGALLAVSSAWLVLYATGADTYYEPTHVSRWDHAQRFMGTWPVWLAVTGAVATSIVLFASAFARRRRAVNLVAAPAAALSCFLLILGWFALTAGH